MHAETAPLFTPRVRSVALAGALGIVLVLAGCSSSAKGTASDTTTSSTGAPRATTTVAPAPTSSSGGGGGGGAQPTTPSGPPPTVATFVTPENIDCHNGNSQMFSASWTTTNAVKSTISIDGAGVYKTYDANASDSLPFNCTSPHTFVVTAYAQDGRTAVKSITLQPRNVQDTTSSIDDTTDTTT